MTGWILLCLGLAIVASYAIVSAGLEAWAVYSAGRKIDRLTKRYGWKQ